MCIRDSGEIASTASGPNVVKRVKDDPSTRFAWVADHPEIEERAIAAMEQMAADGGEKGKEAPDAIRDATSEETAVPFTVLPFSEDVYKRQPICLRIQRERSWPESAAPGSRTITGLATTPISASGTGRTMGLPWSRDLSLIHIFQTRRLGKDTYQFRCVDDDYSSAGTDHQKYALFLCETVIRSDMDSTDSQKKIITFGKNNNYKDSEIRKWLRDRCTGEAGLQMGRCV